MRLLLLGFLLDPAAASCGVSKSLGCFADASDSLDGRLLNGYASLGGPGRPLTFDLCAQQCSDHKFAVAGVEDGHQCFCAAALPKSAKHSTGCSTPCTANRTEMCGGYGKVSVYEFACHGKPPPVPPPPPLPPPSKPNSPNLCPDFSRDYCKAGVPVEQRIEMLMGHMTMADKIATMGEQGIAGKFTDGTALAARSVSWWNEALHGVCRGCGEGGAKCFTQFPEAVAMGCSFNATLWHMIGDTISTEARAAYNVGGLNGLTFFAPQLNMAANPLWGRNMECPGEDPHLTSVYAEMYIKGFQGFGHPSGIKKALNTPKHFTGQLFEGDGSNPWGNGTTVNRQSNDTRYALRDLEQYYLPAFKAAMITAEAGSVMCACESFRPSLPPSVRCALCVAPVFAHEPDTALMLWQTKESTGCRCAPTVSSSTVSCGIHGAGKASWSPTAMPSTP